MALTISETGSETFELPPSGPQAARCSRIIDLGTQKSEYQGETKFAKKLLITWQLAEFRSTGEPFQVSRRFTASLHPKSALRAFLEAWRGRPFSREELAAFDVRKLLNATCMLNLVQINRDGRDYLNIASISPLPKTMAAPAPVVGAIVFDLADPLCGQDLPQLPARLVEQIQQSPEWQAIVSRRPAAPARAAAPAPACSGFDDMDDDIPF